MEYVIKMQAEDVLDYVSQVSAIADQHKDAFGFLELTLDSQHMDDVVIIYWTPDGFERTALPGEGEALALYESAAR